VQLDCERVRGAARLLCSSKGQSRCRWRAGIEGSGGLAIWSGRKLFLPLLGLRSSSGSSGIANGVRCNFFCFHSSSRRTLTLLARAARGRNRLEKPCAPEGGAFRPALKTPGLHRAGYAACVIRRKPWLIDSHRECGDFGPGYEALGDRIHRGGFGSDDVGSESLLKASARCVRRKVRNTHAVAPDAICLSDLRRLIRMAMVPLVRLSCLLTVCGHQTISGS